ncbi:DUF7344 domain-containing protein [Natrinema salsiterrestre]|uniref:DUF7344 domain-containing protein n=1 Tax=Natrinema salsiterrestre TaxID=2950540 RepID=A0A9Q4L827_9EURY|nr:hypothetical protein [Natrinema salsiterrestre]MDF9746936.1 hypothetical protein [Natrinema salsiterrestre]
MVKRLRLEQVDTSEFLDTIHVLLADSVRRNALRYLTTHREPVSLDRLAIELAAADEECDAAEIRPEQRRDVVLRLRHVDLPMLHDAGVVDWNRDADLITLTPLVEHLSVTAPNSRGLLGVSVSVRPEPNH